MPQHAMCIWCRQIKPKSPCAECERRRNREKVQRREAQIRRNFIESVDRSVVYDRDHGLCGICQLPVSKSRYQVDHIQALSNGGEHSYANVQIAHPECNNRKNNRY